MFDTIFIKKKLPLTGELKNLNIKWDEVDFQTKDLDNALDTYEITKSGKLKHLWQKREWKDDDSAFLKGYFDVVEEEWRDVNFHGTINFYTNYTDNSSYHWDYITDNPEQMSWEEIEKIEGFDWWVEFDASFTKGKLDGFKLTKIDKIPIKERFKNNKQWSEKRAEENKKIYKQAINFLRKFVWYRSFIRNITRMVSNIYSKLTYVLYRL